MTDPPSYTVDWRNTEFQFPWVWREEELPATRRVEASPHEVFGAGSRLIATQAATPPPHERPFSGEPVFQGAMLLVALGYCLMLLYLGHTFTIVKVLRGRIYTESLLEEANHSLHVFLRAATALGLLATALALVRIAEWWDGPALAALLPGWVPMLAVPLAAAALGLVMLYRKLLPAIAGSVTLTTPFVHKLTYLRTIVTALTGLFTIPVILLAALNHGPTETAMIWMLIGLLAAGAGLLLRKTQQLFVSAGASILHWFSYLCAVEIFPISLIVGWIIRSGY